MLVSSPDFACHLVDSLSCGVLAIDREGKLCALNADAQRILGCPQGRLEAALGLDCRLALATQPAIASLLQGALDGRTHHARAEIVLGGEGPGRRLGFSLAPVHGPGGGILGAALFFRDLSAFERMDEQARLQDRLAALGEMAARMAHELRNPLAAMRLMAELLERRLVGRDQELSLLRELLAELRAADRVVGEGLDFVHNAPPLFEAIDPTAIVERALARALAGSDFGGALERDYERDLPAVLVDPDQLQAVLTHLVRNALEAMAGVVPPEHQRLELRVRTRPADPARRPYRVAPIVGHEGPGPAAAPQPVPGEGAPRELVISIRDVGPGVPSELRERVFYPFFSTRPEGSGLGLSSAQKMVADHGGRIDLESAVGGGALFHVRLPLLEAQVVAPGRVARCGEAGGG